MNSNPDPRTQPLTGTTNAKRMSKTRKVVLIISGIVIGLVLLGILGIAIIISAFRGNPPSIRDNSVLVLKVAGPLPDYVPDDPFRRLFGGQPLSLNSLLAQLRKAKVDKRITAVLLEIDMPETGFAKARGKSAAEVKTLIDNAPYNAKQAKDVGLIDGAAYRDEVEKELKKRLGYKDSDELHIAKASEYRQISQESLGLNKGEKVAVVYAAGDIVSGKSQFGGEGETTIGSDSLVRTIEEARDDKSVKAIVLRIDSPGGSGLASDIIWRAIESAKEKKPVVVSMSDVAASGGYYIACNANKIVAEPSTIT